MTNIQPPKPSEIRAFQADNHKLRERDLADLLGISEAQLIAACCGEMATRIDAHPDGVMSAAQTFGDVMALTRNPSCAHEKVGLYDNYKPGSHASIVLTEDIGLRLFPSHRLHDFMVEKPTEDGTRRRVQVFDAAGDAVHRIVLRDGSNIAAWDGAKALLILETQSQTVRVT